MKLKYDGELLEHSIDALELGNSIIGFATVVQYLGKQNYALKKIDINVNSFQPGSFDVNFALNIPDAVIGAGLFSSVLTNVDVLKNVFSILKDIISIRKFLKGRKPEAITVNNTNGNFTLTNCDGANITINQNTFVLSNQEQVRKALASFVSPLQNVEGVDEIKLTGIDGEDVKEIGQIAKSEAEYFSYDGKELEIEANKTIKAIATEINTNSLGGKIDMDGRIVYMDFSKIFKIENQYNYLIQSLHHRIPVELISDIEYNPDSTIRKVSINEVVIGGLLEEKDEV